MKLLIGLLVILPVIMAANLDKRIFIDTTPFRIKDTLLAVLDPGTTHDDCVAACPGILTAAGYSSSYFFFCSIACSAAFGA